MMQQHQRFQQQRHYHQHHQQQQQQQIQHQHHPRNHHQHHHHQQQQQHPKVLDKNIQNALNQLVDRLNNPDPHIYTILVGTSDGVGLARAHGTNSNHHHPSAQSQSLSSSSSNFSEEILSGMERIWATLPSGSGHYLKPLKLGDTVKTVTAFYENCTLVHCYKSPLVITFLATPDANIGAIRAILPDLLELLEPTRTTLEK